MRKSYSDKTPSRELAAAARAALDRFLAKGGKITVCPEFNPSWVDVCNRSFEDEVDESVTTEISEEWQVDDGILPLEELLTGKMGLSSACSARVAFSRAVRYTQGKEKTK
jgi:hypothetical protein